MTTQPSTAPNPRAPLPRRAAAELALASFLVLFQELAIIRWAPAQVRVLAYFPNLILLSAFLGLGVGCLRAGRRSLLWLWPSSLLLLALAAVGMGQVVFTSQSLSEHLWLLYYDLGRGAPVVSDVRPPILAIFVLSTVTFVPLGQYVAERLNVFRACGRALWGYSFDIVGSIVGVCAFTAFSFAGTFPAVWFGVVFGAGLVLWGVRPRWWALHLVLAVGTIFLVSHYERASIYSPYYALGTTTLPAGGPEAFSVTTNGSLHQSAIDIARRGRGRLLAQAGYDAAYETLKRRPKRVLILGAGTGNDVAVALKYGASRVDAVEIDPEILRLGRTRHPNRPYRSKRVRSFATDARSFLNSSTEKYDLIVFGTLDSMTRLSALSNVRLDNFVYTKECLEAAHKRLLPGGGMMLYFMVGTKYIDARLNGMLTRIFGQIPVVIPRFFQMFNRIYLAGPAFDHIDGRKRKRTPAQVATMLAALPELPSDDWPFLYLAHRGVSGFYLTLGGAIALLAALGIFLFGMGRGRQREGRRRPDWVMFLFGLAFLLLETKSVTDMSLVWGATWLTNAVVFGSILLTILGATVLAEKRAISWPVAAGGLVVALVVAWAVPLRWLLSVGIAERIGLSVLFIGGPIFFAASCFALLFGKREQAGVAFGWNVLGAVAGGLLEIVGMATGLSSLALLGLTAYMGAFLLHRRQRQKAAE